MSKNTKILVVDDDSGIGEMLKTLLEFNDYQVEVTEKPMETPELIIKHKIDLVLLDKLISGVDGTEVCSEIRRTKEISETPVIMMSALHDAGPQCKGAGADGFIAKPFEMEDLMAKIEKVLKQTSNSV